MKVVIQCAGGKKATAGCFKTADNQNILFVANPNIAKETSGYIYYSPINLSEKNITWSKELSNYNKQNENHHHLLPAYELYDNNIYREIVKKIGVKNVFILSAGWGLIRADFLIPNYNITFSKNNKIKAEFKRDKKDDYPDLCHVPLDSTDDLVFFGGKDYQPLFDKLTAKYRGSRIVFYNSVNHPKMENCRFQKYETRQRTNWHYSCAKELLEGTLTLPNLSV